MEPVINALGHLQLNVKNANQETIYIMDIAVLHVLKL